MALSHPIETSRPRSTGQVLPRLSLRAGFWAIAFSVLVVAAFSTAPSSLYGLYEHQEHLSSLTITFVYAVYAVGVVASLLLAGHVSDWYGRRVVLIPAIAVAAVAAAVFLLWTTLAGLIVARVLTGVAIGAVVAAATPHIADLDAGPRGVPTRRAGIVGTIANVGGLSLGPLIAGLLARYEPQALTLPFEVFLAALVLAGVAVALAPEAQPAADPRPAYRPQRLAVPPSSRRQFTAATTGVFLSWAVGGLFLGAGWRVSRRTTAPPITRAVRPGDLPDLRGWIRRPGHHHELARASPDRSRDRARLDRAGLLVASAWTAPPSLVLFLISGIVAGPAVARSSAAP